MAIRKFSSKDREDDFEFKKLQIESNMYTYLKAMLYVFALINYKNITVWATITVITLACIAIETIQKNKLEQNIRNKKFNKIMIILSSIGAIFGIVNLFLWCI